MIAKRTDMPYQSGNRHGMVKVKRLRTADCVVGGFRYASEGKVVGSLLLGLYDDKGLLHHVGFSSSFQSERETGADYEARKIDQAAGLYRQRARRPQPLGHRALCRMATTGAEASLRSSLRSLHRRAVPSWDKVSEMAAGQESGDASLIW